MAPAAQRESELGKGSTIVLEFILKDEVTPELFAAREARACAESFVIRLGERVSVQETGHLFERVNDRDVPSPFGNGKRLIIACVDEIHISAMDDETDGT